MKTKTTEKPKKSGMSTNQLKTLESILTSDIDVIIIREIEDKQLEMELEYKTEKATIAVKGTKINVLKFSKRFENGFIHKHLLGISGMKVV